MPRFVAVKDGQIRIVSDSIISHNEYNIIELDKELFHISANELIINFKLKNNKIIHKKASKLIAELKIAFVSNWHMKCGISTYAENLLPHIIKQCGDYKLFIEENTNLVGSVNVVGDIIIPNDKIVSCWTRGEPLQRLVNELKKYDPDIIWINHEFGLWHNAGAWLSMMSQLSDYRVITTMHSVFHHKDKTICEAAMPEIITHLQGGADVLKLEKKIPGKVYVIPHGCDGDKPQEQLWNFYKSEHTFMQFGFSFRYKNFESSIRACALLKEKYEDVFFTALLSESDYNIVEHQLYYNELVDLVDKLDVKENVALIRGFQSDETLDSYLRTNKAAVFPYHSDKEHLVYGATGSARLAMAANIPVLTSDVPHFSDTPTRKVNSSQDIADELIKIFSDWRYKDEQIKKQREYLVANTWEKVSQKYIDIFES